MSGIWHPQGFRSICQKIGVVPRKSSTLRTRCTIIGFLRKLRILIRLLALPVLVGGILIIAGTWVRDRPAPQIPNPTNTELVTILLTALTIVLAFFALVIGLLAFWGYATFKTEAARIARRIAKRETSAFLKQHFEGTIGKEIDMRMERWADKYRDGIGVASSYPPQDEAEQEGKVGRDLPDENLPGGLS